RRQELRDWLETTGQEWIEDPSNGDRRFERVRVRLDGDATAHGDAAVRAAFAARRDEAEAAAMLLRDTEAWRFDADNRAADIACGAVRRDGFALALAATTSWAGEGANLAAQGVLDKAVAFCADAPPGHRMTASGCLLVKAGGRVRISRESRNRRETGYGFDHLLASPDFAVAQALAERTGAPLLPVPPVSGYPE
ncbi:MAG: hypothetical protein WAU86_23110, partial [Oricola sp.]